MANNLTRLDPFRDVTRFDPFRGIEDLMRELSRVPALRSTDADQRIRVDVTETDQAYTVKADIPGVKKEDINISIDGNVLSISASTQEEKEETTDGRVYTERYSGSQYRSFSLPQEVDETKTEAKYQDGVLHLVMPKKGTNPRKQITVQ